jgi:hypothetical protein
LFFSDFDSFVIKDIYFTSIPVEPIFARSEVLALGQQSSRAQKKYIK